MKTTVNFTPHKPDRLQLDRDTRRKQIPSTCRYLCP